jgi:2-methylcitrate dehydratase PrpD
MAGDSIAQQLAAFVVSTDSAAIPASVRRRAALHLLDTVGCGLAAVGTGAAEHATAVALAQAPAEEAALLGLSARASAAGAALANGTRCHALDFDDTHERGICHSSTVVAPAALALGEARDRAGREVLDAYVLGSEVALRIATGTADGLYARGFHPTSVCGAFGAAAASARLLGLDAQRATCALGIVGSFAAGLFEYLSDGSQTKPLHAGWAAQAGVHAALLAEAGATGPTTVIEGRFGLVASHTDSEPGSMTDGLGESWELGEVSIKPFPACHFAHSSTWAAAALAEEHALRLGDVAEIRVRIPAEGEPLILDPLEDKHRPRTPYAAKFSLPFTVAHHLVHGRLGVSSFTAETIRDPKVLELAARVRGEPLREHAPSRFAGGARLVMRDGAELDRFIEHAPGSPGNPLDNDWLLAKFRANAELALYAPAAERLANALLAIDEAPALAPVLALAQVPAGRAGAS